MKKSVFTILMVLGVLFTYSQARFEVGLKAGLNLTSISSDAEATYDSRSGFHGGAYGLIKLANIGIQPELLYSQQGTEVDFDQVEDDFEQDFVYLNIPVMVKFYLVGGLNLQLGPQFGMLLSADGTTIDPDTGEEVGISDESFKNSDISAAMGAGWDAPFGLNLTARYLLGLNDVNDVSNGFEARNRVFQLSLGYRLIKIGK